MLLEVLGTLRKCYVSSLLGLTTFPLTRARVSRALAENDSLHSDHRARARGAGKGHRGHNGDTRGAGKGHNGTHLVRCYVSSPVAKTLVLDWKS